MTPRESLVKQLKEHVTKTDPTADIGMLTENWYDIADFILADRRRIVEPLVELKKDEYVMHEISGVTIKAIDETLKLAGD